VDRQHTSQKVPRGILNICKSRRKQSSYLEGRQIYRLYPPYRQSKKDYRKQPDSRNFADKLVRRRSAWIWSLQGNEAEHWRLRIWAWTAWPNCTVQKQSVCQFQALWIWMYWLLSLLQVKVNPTLIRRFTSNDTKEPAKGCLKLSGSCSRKEGVD